MNKLLKNNMTTLSPLTKYCPICKKDIAGPGEVHIAGSICPGHTIIELLVYKIKRILKGGE